MPPYCLGIDVGIGVQTRSKVMIGYGIFLIAGALVAISISGWDRSKTALFSSGGAAMMMVVAALMASSRVNALQKLGGIAGFALPLVFAGTFGWRLSLNKAKPTAEQWLAQNPGMAVDTAQVQSALQNWLFPVFIVGSVLTFVILVDLVRKTEAHPEAVMADGRAATD